MSLTVDWTASEFLSAEAKRGRDGEAKKADGEEGEKFYVTVVQKIERTERMEAGGYPIKGIGVIEPMKVRFVVGPFDEKKIGLSKESAISALGDYDGVEYFDYEYDENDEPIDTPEADFVTKFDDRTPIIGTIVVRGSPEYSLSTPDDVDRLAVVRPEGLADLVSPVTLLDDGRTKMDQFTKLENEQIVAIFPLATRRIPQNASIWERQVQNEKRITMCATFTAPGFYVDSQAPQLTRILGGVVGPLRRGFLMIPKILDAQGAADEPRTVLELGLPRQANVTFVRKFDIDLARLRRKEDGQVTETAAIVANAFKLPIFVENGRDYLLEALSSIGTQHRFFGIDTADISKDKRRRMQASEDDDNE